jgi:dephospho-CoA kinase
MYCIGISGGIASGKSTIVNMLKAYGAVVIDCDELAKAVVDPGSAGLQAVAKAFGPKTILADGSMDRAYIGSIVFQSPERKQELEDILHPLIYKEIDAEKLRIEKSKTTEIIFLDMPLLFELKYCLYVDEAWLVYVDPETQLKRLMARNNYTENEALARIHAQLPIDEKRSLAQVIIDNTGSLDHTEAQVHDQWEKLVARVHARGGKVEAEAE